MSREEIKPSWPQTCVPAITLAYLAIALIS
jgi:hypothetical protein